LNFASLRIGSGLDKFLAFGDENDHLGLYLIVAYIVLFFVATYFAMYVEIAHQSVTTQIGAFFKKTVFCEGSMTHKKIELENEVIVEREEIEKLIYGNQLNEHVLIAKNLRKQFGARLAVNDISFKIKAGQIYGLLGTKKFWPQ
jgi:hypothetical protein